MPIGMLPKSDFNQLFDVLHPLNFKVVGPHSKDGAIIYETLENTDDLPIGIIDHQNPGEYKLESTKQNTFFAYTVGPHSFKKFLDPPRRQLMSLQKRGNQIEIQTPIDNEKPFAFLGVRACEINAILIQDKVFITSQLANEYYRSKRESTLILAVNCQRASETCFCPSMQSGPQISEGADLVLTEFTDDFAIEWVSEKGKNIFEKLILKEADSNIDKRIHQQVQTTEESIKRKFPKNEAQELLKKLPEDKFWQDVAQICTSCANCTLSCPTCFCSTVEDVTDLTGEHSERWKRWDSCFNPDFSYIHGGEVRKSTASKYRQWLTHKFSYWQDQFDTSGCVGCGRCLTWCPVGIDFTSSIKKLIKGDNCEK